MLVTSTIQTRPREILPTSQGRDAAAEEQQGAEATGSPFGGSAYARPWRRGRTQPYVVVWKAAVGGGIHDEGPIGSRVQREGKECCSGKKNWLTPLRCVIE